MTHTLQSIRDEMSAMDQVARELMPTLITALAAESPVLRDEAGRAGVIAFEFARGFIEAGRHARAALLNEAEARNG
jgi:hypothetical protein